VQGWLADAIAENERETYETVKCLAFKQVHFISRLTGNALGTEGE